MFKTHKTIYFILTILGLLAIGGGLIFAILNFRTEEETNAAYLEAIRVNFKDHKIPSDWQTYKSEQYGYKIKIPKGWEISKGWEIPEQDNEMVYFGVPFFSEDKRQKNFWLAFGITRMRKADYDKAVKERVLAGQGYWPAAGELGIKGNWIYYYTFGQDWIPGVSVEQEKLIEILSTFKFISQ